MRGSKLGARGASWEQGEQTGSEGEQRVCYTMCHSSRPFCTRHIPGFGLVGQTPGPSKMLSRRDGLLGRQARVRRAPLYACGWIRLCMLAHA